MGASRIVGNGKLNGGKVIITTNEKVIGIHEREMALLKQNGNAAYDMLYLVSHDLVIKENGSRHFSLADEFEKAGITIWDGTNSYNRRTYSINNDAVRLLQYDSSRGLEGWTVVCMGFDSFLEKKESEYEESGSKPVAGIDYGKVTEKSEKLNNYIETAQEKVKQEVKDQIKEVMAKQDGSAELGIMSGVDDVALTDLTGAGTDYAFIYDGMPYSAQYTPDNWEIKDSYKIKNAMDMAIICQALINEHPIHGKDMVSYRTCDDMAYEWVQHNIAYSFLSEDSKWMESVKNVDFDPKDQGKSYRNLYEDRTGKKFDIQSFLE